MDKKANTDPQAKNLRDEFALVAISGLAQFQYDHPEKIAERAYILADKMLQERNKKPEAK